MGRGHEYGVHWLPKDERLCDMACVGFAAADEVGYGRWTLLSFVGCLVGEEGGELVAGDTDVRAV